MKSIKEREVEYLYSVFHAQLLEPGLIFKGRDYRYKHGLIVDILFKDKKGIDVIFEIKTRDVTVSDIGRLFKIQKIIDKSKTRIILVAPEIDGAIKELFKSFNIEFVTLNISRLLN